MDGRGRGTHPNESGISNRIGWSGCILNHDGCWRGGWRDRLAGVTILRLQVLRTTADDGCSRLRVVPSPGRIVRTPFLIAAGGDFNQFSRE